MLADADDDDLLVECLLINVSALSGFGLMLPASLCDTIFESDRNFPPSVSVRCLRVPERLPFIDGGSTSIADAEQYCDGSALTGCGS